MHLVPPFVEVLEEDLRQMVIKDAGAKAESKEHRFHDVVGNLSGVTE
jgi:hypothetical protein